MKAKQKIGMNHKEKQVKHGDIKEDKKMVKKMVKKVFIK